MGLVNYNLACIHCLRKNKEEAYDFLRKAVEIEQKYKKDAIEDVDFEWIRNEEGFKQLTS